MLSEVNKERLEIAVRGVQQEYGVSVVVRPGVVLDTFLRHWDGSSDPHIINLRDNRDEAVRYLGGLLGLM